MRRGAISLGAVAIALGIAAPGSFAAVAPTELDVGDAVLMSRDELDGARGGFSVGTFNLSFGIKISTTINNVLTVQTVLSIDSSTLTGKITTSTTAIAQKVNETVDKVTATVAAIGDKEEGAATSASTTLIASVEQPPVEQPESENSEVAATPSGADGESVVSQAGPSTPESFSVETAPSSASEPPAPAPSAAPEQVASLSITVPTTPESLGASDAATITIPDAAGLVSEVQEQVTHSEIGDFLPSQTEPISVVEAPLQIEVESLSAAQNLAQTPSFEAPPVSETIVLASNEITTESVENTPSGEVLSNLEADQATGTGVVGEAGATVTEIPNGAVFDLGGTVITHQILNGILASIQNSNNDVQIDQTVEMMVDIENFGSTIGSAQSTRQAAALGDEVARFSSSLGD